MQRKYLERENGVAWFFFFLPITILITRFLLVSFTLKSFSSAYWEEQFLCHSRRLWRECLLLTFIAFFIASLFLVLLSTTLAGPVSRTALSQLLGPACPSLFVCKAAWQRGAYWPPPFVRTWSSSPHKAAKVPCGAPMLVLTILETQLSSLAHWGHPVRWV